MDGLSHKELAASCFNKVWDLLEKEERSSEENEQMVHLCHSSFWHWTQVEDHTPQNVSIGYWQLSRVYAVVGRGEEALHYAKRCISVSLEADLPPFFIAYAYEAEARAYKVIGQHRECENAVAQAYIYVEKIVIEDNKQLVEKDLEQI